MVDGWWSWKSEHHIGIWDGTWILGVDMSGISMGYDIWIRYQIAHDIPNMSYYSIYSMIFPWRFHKICYLSRGIHGWPHWTMAGGPSLAESGRDWKNASLAGSAGAGGWEGHLGGLGDPKPLDFHPKIWGWFPLVSCNSWPKSYILKIQWLENGNTYIGYMNGIWVLEIKGKSVGYSVAHGCFWFCLW